MSPSNPLHHSNHFPRYLRLSLLLRHCPNNKFDRPENYKEHVNEHRTGDFSVARGERPSFHDAVKGPERHEEHACDALIVRENEKLEDTDYHTAFT